jgi:hypothetical protein
MIGQVGIAEGVRSVQLDSPSRHVDHPSANTDLGHECHRETQMVKRMLC